MGADSWLRGCAATTTLCRLMAVRPHAGRIPWLEEGWRSAMDEPEEEEKEEGNADDETSRS